MTPPSKAALDAGLKAMLTDVPLRSGYAQLGAGYDPTVGAWARAEAGAHLAPNFGVFGFAEQSSRVGPSAGVGARWTFSL